jgi:hypothetical protein
MDTSAGPIATYRRYWLPELIVLVALDGTAQIRIPVRGLHRVTVRLRHGDIRVFYETHSATSRRALKLDLQTREGRVFQSQQ